MILLEDDIIKLRAVEPTDLDALYRWENDTSLWTMGSSMAPFSRKQLWDYINDYTDDIYTARQLRLMIERKVDGDLLGTIDMYDFDPFNMRAGIGILIDSAYSRQGYGARAMQLLTQYAQYLGLHQLWAVVPATNVASMGMFKKCGFAIAGHLRSWLRISGRYQDAYIYQRLLS